MDYTDVYFLQDVTALTALLVAVALACYWARRRYHRNRSESRRAS